MPARAGLLIAVSLWLGLLAASWAMAGATFRTVDAVLSAPETSEAGRRLARVGGEDRRPLLRHLASEINRWMFARFGWAQAALALVATLLAWRAGGAARTLAAAALLLLLVQAVALAPQIQSLGRTLDFVPRPLPRDLARRFGLLHAAYVGLDLLKAGTLVALAALLARRP